MFATESRISRLLREASSRAFNGAGTDVTTMNSEAQPGQTERLGPNAAGTIKNPGRARQPAFQFGNGAEHRSLTLQ